jgi:hypothetical protein
MAVGKLLRAGAMRRLSALFLCLMLVMSLGVGSVAHAAEGPVGVEISAATSIGHADGDGDQVPADSQKGYPHHHAECHGHDIGVPIASNSVASVTEPRVTPSTWNNGPVAPSPSDPALRPPQA